MIVTRQRAGWGGRTRVLTNAEDAKYARDARAGSTLYSRIPQRITHLIEHAGGVGLALGAIVAHGSVAPGR
jgi:hypothetical protein